MAVVFSPLKPLPIKQRLPILFVERGQFDEWHKLESGADVFPAWVG